MSAPAEATPAALPEPPLALGAPLEALYPGAGGVARLHALGLRHVRDLLHHYPHRHEDRRVLQGLVDIADGEKVTVTAVIVSKAMRNPRPGLHILEVTLEDDWGRSLRASWFQQRWLFRSLHEGERITVTGRARHFGKAVTINVEAHELEGQATAGEGGIHAGRITPVYPSKDGTPQTLIREATWLALERAVIDEPLSARIRESHGLTTLEDALRGIHFPEDEAHLTRALTRLRFDEYLFLELRMLLQGEASVLTGTAHAAREADITAFGASMPFDFTGAQRRVLSEIAEDMRSERQMARLVQGDVGSGKTAVAACALYLTTQDGHQGALMAPTEILARQHFQNMQKYLMPLGVRAGLLVGAFTAAQKRAVLAAVAEGEIDVLVGTQALVQEGVAFRDLGLAVIDEEHRFGVEQRRTLLQGRPDVLVMSATPIPRSLALTAYADLELSIIDELPPGRTPIRTKIVTQEKRKGAYIFAMNQIREGRQAYVVASLVEENETLADLRAATALCEELKVTLPDARVALLHGKMAAAEKDDVMRAFRNHAFDLLVSTTVIEVGVDVPNASVIIIENAERFGLAQLHQLRGRVGRGAAESYCVLLAGDASKKTMERLGVIEGSTDGFVIAEADLKLRGPGELRGTRQSGLPELRLGDLARDTEIIETTRELAKSVLAHDPHLAHPRLVPLRAELQARSARVALREVI